MAVVVVAGRAVGPKPSYIEGELGVRSLSSTWSLKH